MTKTIAISKEEFSEALHYDPATGALTWKIAPRRNTRPGSPAGAIKNARAAGKEPKRFLYISYKHFSTTAARVIWLLQTGEWPKNNILFNDGNTLNLRWENLRLGNFTTGEAGAMGPRKMSRVAERHYALKRYYGLTGEDYGRMLAAQGGVCEVCSRPEVRLRPDGTPTPLHVDHDHETGKVRSLLCYTCNSGLGSFADDPARLRAAADYIERHRTALKVVR